jgi:hypothetical protein
MPAAACSSGFFSGTGGDAESLRIVLLDRKAIPIIGTVELRYRPKPSAMIRMFGGKSRNSFPES